MHLNTDLRSCTSRNYLSLTRKEHEHRLYLSNNKNTACTTEARQFWLLLFQHKAILLNKKYFFQITCSVTYKFLLQKNKTLESTTSWYCYIFLKRNRTPFLYKAQRTEHCPTCYKMAHSHLIWKFFHLSFACQPVTLVVCQQWHYHMVLLSFPGKVCLGLE